MIGPSLKVLGSHPRSVLKRKQTSPPVPEVAAKRAQSSSTVPSSGGDELVDIVSHVCNYETISEYIQLFGSEQGQGGSPASMESGYQTSAPDDEDSNLSWLLNFKVSSLFDPAEEQAPPKKDEVCICSRPNGYHQHHRSSPGKPPFTYTELIEKALREQGELTVSGIYNWISSKYPFYNPNDDRWKNSVRHNLSINPHFRKGIKSRHGAGHLWTLSNEGVNPPPESWRKCRTTTDVIRSESPAMLDEAAIAAATIMQLDPEPDDPPATIDAMPVHGEIQVEPDPVLHRVAEEILSGVKRRVEVQYLVHDQNTNGPGPIYSEDMWWPDHTIYLTVPSDASWTKSYFPHHFLDSNSNYITNTNTTYNYNEPPIEPKIEFLNPVSKEELVSESGLDADHCEATSSLFSELNSDLHLPDNLFTEELGFACY